MNDCGQMSAQLAKAKVKAEDDAKRAVVHNAQQLLQLLRARATASESNGQLAFKRFAKNAQVHAHETIQFTFQHQFQTNKKMKFPTSTVLRR